MALRIYMLYSKLHAIWPHRLGLRQRCFEGFCVAFTARKCHSICCEYGLNVCISRSACSHRFIMSQGLKSYNQESLSVYEVEMEPQTRTSNS